MVRQASLTEHTCPRPGRGPFINGVRIDPVSIEDFLNRISAFLECGLSHVVHFIPADPTVRAMQDRNYADVLNAGDLNVADGMSVVWASRLLGAPARRLAGSDAMGLLLRWGLARELRHYIYGSTPAVIARLRTRLDESYSDLRLAGVVSPPFGPQLQEGVTNAAGAMRDAGADLVWVGLGTPKQDLVAEDLRLLSAAPVILCVGAAFDFLAGTRRRAPVVMQRLGLEWLHRLVQEPGRLWERYLIGNSRFVAGVLLSVARGTGRRSGRGAASRSLRHPGSSNSGS